MIFQQSPLVSSSCKLECKMSILDYPSDKTLSNAKGSLLHSSNNEEVEKEVSLYPLYAAFIYIVAQLAGESTGCCF